MTLWVSIGTVSIDSDGSNRFHVRTNVIRYEMDQTIRHFLEKLV